jgi:putative transposase
LDTAFTNFFENRTDYPVFKKKHGVQAASYAANAFSWNGTKLSLAKQQEPLAIVWSRPLPDGAKPSSVTITRDKVGRYARIHPG